jgi:hypothetical protein
MIVNTDIAYENIGIRIKSSRFNFSNFLSEFREGLEEVSLEPVVRDLEYRLIGAVVDSDYAFRVLHPREVLHGARDAHGDVEVGGDHLAGLPDLHLVGAEAGVDGGSGGTDGCFAEGLGELVDDVKVLFALHAATPRDDDPGGGEFGFRGVTFLFADECGLGDIVIGVDKLNGCLIFAVGGFWEGRRADGEEVDGLL